MEWVATKNSILMNKYFSLWFIYQTYSKRQLEIETPKVYTFTQPYITAIQKQCISINIYSTLQAQQHQACEWVRIYTYISWTTIVVHNRDQLEIFQKSLIECTTKAALLALNLSIKYSRPFPSDLKTDQEVL